jgi:glycerol kinase
MGPAWINAFSGVVWALTACAELLGIDAASPIDGLWRAALLAVAFCWIAVLHAVLHGSVPDP